LKWNEMIELIEMKNKWKEIRYLNDMNYKENYKIKNDNWNKKIENEEIYVWI